MNAIGFHFYSFGRFILRLPQAPFEDILTLLGDSNLINTKMQEPSIREAIYLASPLLDREIQKFLDGQIKTEKEKNRICNSFLKYYTRFCTRCTPYGTFATCTCAKIGYETSWNINRELQRHIQFDTYFLSEFIRYISMNNEIRSRIKYYTNTSIYTVGKKYRYIEYEYKKERRLHKISSVEKEKYLDAILNKGKNGIMYQDIIKVLTAFEVDLNDAIEYTDDLIRNQLLLGEFELKLNEKDILNQLATFFEENNFVQENILIYKEFILYAKKTFQLINKAANSEGILESYREIIKKAQVLPCSVEENNILHVDSELRYHCDITIGDDIIGELNEVISFYCKFCSLQSEGRLNQFSNVFQEKYECQEIPLLVALDPEIGIGYPPNHGQADSPVIVSKFKKFINNHYNRYVTVDTILLNKLLDLNKHGKKEIVFEDKDFENINYIKKVPDVLFCIFKIVKDNTCHIVEPQIGTSPTSIIGRFGYMNQEIENLLKNISQKEQDFVDDAIYAEIKHVPSSRIGNINNITHIWDYEILLLTGSQKSESAQIPVSDLMLSNRNGVLVLRSKKLNKRVIPVLSNAHKYDFDTQPVYKFLCDMQYQGRKGYLCFDWGNLRQVLNHFPRVRYNNTIISLESWILNVNEIEKICINKNMIDEIRCQREIPRYVYLVDGDNTLLVDFNSQASSDAFISTIKNRHEIVLKETMIDEFKDNDFPYANECIVPLYNGTKKK